MRPATAPQRRPSRCPRSLHNTPRPRASGTTSPGQPGACDQQQRREGGGRARTCLDGADGGGGADALEALFAAATRPSEAHRPSRDRCCTHIIPKVVAKRLAVEAIESGRGAGGDDVLVAVGVRAGDLTQVVTDVPAAAVVRRQGSRCAVRTTRASLEPLQRRGRRSGNQRRATGVEGAAVGGGCTTWSAGRGGRRRPRRRRRRTMGATPP
eukprot:COSAG04_NODE_28_length_36566_cov_70.886665_15_plen_211_part_00